MLLVTCSLCFGGESCIRRQFCLSEPNLLSHLLKKKMSTSTTQLFVLILVSEAVSPPFLPQLSTVVFGYKILENLTRVNSCFKSRKMMAYIQILVT